MTLYDPCNTAASIASRSRAETEWFVLSAQIAGLAPGRGRYVVQVAKAAGMDPHALLAITLRPPGGPHAPRGDFPRLEFSGERGSVWSASPSGCVRIG
jgi:hypothetical protein